MRNRVYVTVEGPSICLSGRLSHRSTAATAVGGFAAERPAGRRHQLTAMGAEQQAQVLNRSRWRRPNTDSCLHYAHIQQCLIIITIYDLIIVKVESFR